MGVCWALRRLYSSSHSQHSLDRTSPLSLLSHFSLPSLSLRSSTPTEAAWAPHDVQANFTSTGNLTLTNATNVNAPGTTASGISGEVTGAAGTAGTTGVDAGPRDDRYYLGMYGGTLLLGLVIMLIGASMAAQVRVRTARALHDGMLKKVLRAPISFYDVTPLGRVLNRFSKDQNNVDIQLSMMLMWAVCVINFCLSSFLAIVISASGIGLVVVVPALGLYYLILRYVRVVHIHTYTRTLVAATVLQCRYSCFNIPI